MNNNTKSANIMTWNRFNKLFKPKKVYETNKPFPPMIVSPTLRNIGFKEMSILDIDEKYNYNAPKPLDMVKDNIDIFKYTYIIYYLWKYRDGSGKGLSIFYK